MLVTLLIFQLLSDWLNDVALSNIEFMLVTLLTFQLLRLELNAVYENICDMFVTLLTSQLFKFDVLSTPERLSIQLNIELKLVIPVRLRSLATDDKFLQDLKYCPWSTPKLKFGPKLATVFNASLKVVSPFT